MGASGNGNSLCHEAREYYYDLLCHEDAAVPETIVRHVEHCPFCRDQIDRLKDAVSETASPADASDSAGDGIVEVLSRQFGYLGEPVDCSHVKPFLPDLLIPSHQVRIPTPITVHVEHCPQCAQDLASIHKLGLTDGQLERLSLFYGRSAGRDGLLCGEALSATVALAAFSLEGFDPVVLDHVSVCPRCRARVHRQRAHARGSLPAGPARDGILSCGEISTADLLDYVMPFGLAPAAINRADGRRDALVTHVRACRRCMDRAQSLHETIYAIAERADSEIRTLYHSQDDAQDACGQAGASVYRYPVRVEVLQRQEVPDAAGDPPVACGRSERRTRAGRMAKLPFKTFAAAAAVVAASWLMMNASTATGMSVRDLLRAVERAANVHVISRYGDLPQPSHEMWVARDPDMFAIRTGAECTVYDLGKRNKRVIRPDLGPGASVKLTRQEFDRGTTLMRESLGNIFGNALPDDNFSPAGDVPSDRPGGLWSVYELTQRYRTSSGVAMLYRWRVFIDPALQLPVRIECLHRDSEELPWRSAGVTTFTYPSETEMENEIRALSRQQAQ